MRKVELTITFLIITVCSFGQKNWEKKFNGYVITPDSTVIKGYLKIDVGSLDKGKRIKLYKRPNDKPQEFYTFELLGYAVKKDTFEIIRNFRPTGNQKPVVDARVVSRGKLVLYEIEEIYHIPTQITVIISYAIMSPDGEIIHSKSMDFNEHLNLLLTDAPDLILHKRLKFKDLERTIKEYNRRFKM